MRESVKQRSTAVRALETMACGVSLSILLAGCGTQGSANYGTITTLAGNGTHGDTGDGGAGTAAELNAPACVAVDAAGNVYATDSASHVVRRVSASGTITTYAGTGSAGYAGDGGLAAAAQLNGPQGCALDAAGNLYIADANNDVIRRVAAATGIITTVAGNGIGAGIFPTPFGGDGGPATAAGLGHPFGVAVDAAGNLYISDTVNQRVRKVTAATGIITTLAGNGVAQYAGDGGAATAGSLYNPEGLALDAAGNVYVAEEGNSVVREIAASGALSTFAGSSTYGFVGDGGAANAARLNGPTSVALNSAGDVFITDAGNNLVRRVHSGTIQSVAGTGNTGYTGDTGAATSADLTTPRGVALDASGRMYIADTGNGVVRKVQP